ncbi:uncharacterized protein LOC111126830 [Crassostrea virginica]
MMILVRFAILGLVVGWFGTWGQFYQNEVFVEIQEFPDECVMEAQEGQVFVVHYRAYLPDGTMFFSSYDSQKPVVLLPTTKQSLRGGILGMCVGEVRLITVPSYLGYGDQDHVTEEGIVIPANSDLTYEVKLLFTNDADSMIEAFEAIDYDGDGYLDPNEIRYQMAILDDEAAILDINLDDADLTGKLAETVVRNNDLDKDGKLSRDEYLGIVLQEV